jgi:hypothetical protein
MESATGILLGKIGFYLALVALVVIVIIKKRKQVRSSQQNRDLNNQHKTKQ